MNILLWVLQVLLAVVFLAHGLLMLFPPAEILAQMNAMMPRGFGLFLGVAELAAAVGLTLPGITRIRPWLIPCAAAGVMVVMIGATILHAVRGEVAPSFVTATLLGLATFVAYMRWKIRPIVPRTVR